MSSRRPFSACGSNEQTPRLKSAIGFNVGTDAEMRGDICSTRDDTTTKMAKDLAGLIDQHESCKTLSRHALVPARAQRVLSERAVRTFRLAASPERSTAPLYIDARSERSGPAWGLSLEAALGLALAPTREPTLDPALRLTLYSAFETAATWEGELSFTFHGVFRCRYQPTGGPRFRIAVNQLDRRRLFSDGDRYLNEL